MPNAEFNSEFSTQPSEFGGRYHHRLAPRRAPVALEHARTYVTFVAANVVGRGRFETFTEQAAALPDELNPVFRGVHRPDGHRDLPRVCPIVGELHASRRVEVAAIERVD